MCLKSFRWCGRVIIVTALSLSLRDKDRLRDKESLTINFNLIYISELLAVSGVVLLFGNIPLFLFWRLVRQTISPPLYKSLIITCQQSLVSSKSQDNHLHTELCISSQCPLQYLSQFQVGWWMRLWASYSGTEPSKPSWTMSPRTSATSSCCWFCIMTRIKFKFARVCCFTI